MGRNTPESPGNAKKRRRTTTPASVPQSSPVPDLVPPPLSGYGDTVYASNPFDDAPSSLPAGMPHPGGMSGMGPPGHGGGMPAHMQGGHGPPMGAGPMGPMPPNGIAGPYGPNMFHMGPGGGGSMGHGPGMAGNGLGPGGMMPGMSGPSSMPGNPGPMNHMSHNMPPVSTMQSMNDVGGPMGMGGGMPTKGMSHSSRKVYPPDQPMVFNPQNPNAPPIYPCGMCHKEVHENDQAILCESGCNFWFHRMCTGLMEQAYHLLIAEVYAEWVCDRCLSTKNIPLIKFKP